MSIRNDKSVWIPFWDLESKKIMEIIRLRLKSSSIYSFLLAFRFLVATDFAENKTNIVWTLSPAFPTLGMFCEVGPEECLAGLLLSVLIMELSPGVVNKSPALPRPGAGWPNLARGDTETWSPARSILPQNNTPAYDTLSV